MKRSNWFTSRFEAINALASPGTAFSVWRSNAADASRQGLIEAVKNQARENDIRAENQPPLGPDALFARANEIVSQQNAAADLYGTRNPKSDSYVTALTILAAAFFLADPAQAVKNNRLRFSSTGFGVVATLFSLFLTAPALAG